MIKTTALKKNVLLSHKAKDVCSHCPNISFFGRGVGVKISTCADSQLPTDWGGGEKEYPPLPVNYKMHEPKEKKKKNPYGYFRPVGLFIFIEIKILPIKYFTVSHFWMGEDSIVERREYSPWFHIFKKSQQMQAKSHS